MHTTTATSPLSLHDALPIFERLASAPVVAHAIVLSARTPDRLRERAQQMLTLIENGQYGDADLADIAYTLQTGREAMDARSEEHTSELQSRFDLVCRLLLEK